MMSVLLPESWPFSVDWLPPSAYLVGGAVRDALLNRQSDYLDLDFIIPTQAIALAQKIAKHYHAGFVILDAQRQIARIVFPHGTVDLAQQEGDSIQADLARRDFTINAIAYNPFNQSFVDPLGGLVDLAAQQLKMIAMTNLEEDPLRLLRAYRQSAQLNFTIEANTQQTLRNLAPLLAQIAPERVQSELNLLLTNPRGSYWLAQAYSDQVLTVWLNSITPTKITQLDQIDSLIPWLCSNWSEIPWETEIKHLAKLTCLVDDNPQQAHQQLLNLKYPKDVFNGLKSVLQSLAELSNIQHSLTLREQYFFFLGIHKYFPILALVALAKGINPDLINALLNRYNNPLDLAAHPQPLVTGNDLINYLQIKPSPRIGYLLTEIQIAQLEGKISTPPEALIFAKLQL